MLSFFQRSHLRRRKTMAKAAVDLLGKKRKKDANIPPASAAATAVEAPILAGHPPEVASLRKKQKISQSVNEKNDVNVGNSLERESQSGRPKTMRRFFFWLASFSICQALVYFCIK
jgi:hypothetical protein